MTNANFDLSFLLPIKFEEIVQNGRVFFQHNVRFENYKICSRYSTSTRSRVRIAWYPTGMDEDGHPIGNLMIRSVISPRHEAASSMIIFYAGSYNFNASGIPAIPLNIVGSSTVSLGNGANTEPDVSISVLNRLHQSPNIVFEHDYHRGRSVDQFLNDLRYYIIHSDNIEEVIGISTYERMENISGMYCIQFRRNQHTQQPDLVGITSFGRENLQSPIVEELESYFRAHYPSCPQPVVIRGRGRNNRATMQHDPPCDYDHRVQPRRRDLLNSCSSGGFTRSRQRCLVLEP